MRQLSLEVEAGGGILTSAMVQETFMAGTLLHIFINDLFYSVIVCVIRETYSFSLPSFISYK